MSEHREEERNGLARTCLSDTDDITTRHNSRNGLRLDGSGGDIVELLDNLETKTLSDLGPKHKKNVLTMLQEDQNDSTW